MEVSVYERFVDLGSRSAQRLGLSRSLGQIYAALYLSADPLGLNDLMQRLQISKGSASMGLRQLEAWGAVRQVWVKGDRRIFYVANTDFPAVLKQFLTSILKPRVESTGNQIRDLQTQLDSAKPAGITKETRFMRERLARLDRMRRKIERVLPALEAILQ